MRSIAWFLVALLAACQGARAPRAPSVSEPVWVGRRYAGGAQCPFRAYRPPDARAVLDSAGVAVLETRNVSLAVCDGCDCPSYHMDHLALIVPSDLERAAVAGFSPRPGPSPR